MTPPPLETSSQKENERVSSYLEVTWFQSHQEQPDATYTRGIASKPTPKRAEQSVESMPPSGQTRYNLHKVEELETAAPMDCPVYFASPVQTIVESVQDNPPELHDIADAYSTLSMRILDNADTISQVDRVFVALDLIKCQASVITTALRRDIHRAFLDPVGESRPEGSLVFEDSIFSPLDLRPELTEDEIKNAQNQSHVCHHSLQFLSDIFRFPTFQNLFSVDQLGDLFDDILSIAFATSLPMLSAQKSHLFCLWVLQTQRLPFQFLTPRNSKLVMGLTNIIETRPDMGSVIESVKVIRHLIRRQAAIYIPEFSELLPTLLRCLVSASSILRHEVAHVLVAIAQGYLTARVATCTRISISEHILSFVDAQISKRKTVAMSPTADLSQIINNALDQPDDENRPQWAIALLASIITLSDSSIFLHKRCLKLVLPALSKISVHASRSVRAFYVPLWKCIVWAFARLKEIRVSANGGKVEVDRLIGCQSGSDLQSVYDSAFYLSKEELKSDIGPAIVGVVLGRSDLEERGIDFSADIDDDVAKALQILKDLVGSQETQQTGMSLLIRLTSGIGSSSFPPGCEGASAVKLEWDYNQVLTRELFDGSVLSAERSHFQVLASRVGSIEINSVHRLSEVQICRHWDFLLQIWVDCVMSFQPAVVPANLLQVWQALLLSQTQLTQGRGHFTTPPEFAHNAAAVVTDFLQTDKKSTRPRATVATAALTIRLWTVMKNVFASAWLSITGEPVLSKLMMLEFDLKDSDMKSLWSTLANDLVSMGIPTVINMLLTEREDVRTRGANRLLWEMVAKNWQPYEDKLQWQVAVDFLILPLRSWPMSQHEGELWDTVVRCVVRMAAVTSVKPVEVMQHIVEKIRIGGLGVSGLASPISSLLSHVHLGDLDEFPTSIFAMAEEWLRSNYPPEREGQTNVALGLFLNLKRIMSSIPTPFVLPFLASLSDGLCLWIKDDSETVPQAEYNDLIMSFYKQALNMLQKLPPDVDLLHQFAPFLVSSFHRIPSPALGPIAFKRFWDLTYQGSHALSGSYPEAIKRCLRAYHEVYGGDPPTGITIGSSQLTDESQGVSSAALQPTIELQVALPPEESPPEHPATPGGQTRAHSPNPFLDNSTSSTNIIFSSDNHRQPRKRRKISGEDSSQKLQSQNVPGQELLLADTAQRTQHGRSLRGSGSVLGPGLLPDVEDDYDNWETRMSSPEIRHLDSLASSDIDDVIRRAHITSQSGNHHTSPKRASSPDCGLEDECSQIMSPSMRSRRSGPPHAQAALHRGDGSVEILQHAFDAMRTDASQLPVVDLIQATSLAQQLQSVLQDKLKRKLQAQGLAANSEENA